jgi:hypothetical protein
MASAELKAYFPGVFRHDGLSLYTGAQHRQRGNYRSYNDVNLPVGWNLTNLPGWWRNVDKDVILTGSARYCFPLLYPDWNISKVLYFRRIKAALFYDFASVGGDDIQNGKVSGTYKKGLNSLGVDISGDINFLRFYAPVEAGVKAAYLPANRKPYFELILSVDFNSL